MLTGWHTFWTGLIVGILLTAAVVPFVEQFWISGERGFTQGYQGWSLRHTSPPGTSSPLAGMDVKECSVAGYQYVSSPAEEEWLANIKEWQEVATFCKVLDSKALEAQRISQVVLQANQLLASGRPMPDTSEATALLSKEVYTLNCGGTTQTVVDWIEPLWAFLRHPEVGCVFGENNLLNRSYLLLGSGASPRHHRHARNLLIDLGASTYRTGPGGSSQNFLVDTYRARGIEFDRMLLWEANPKISSKQVFDEMPPELAAAYQYFHMPASPDVHDPRSPLSILKKLATPADFVVFKLDIDAAPVENAFVAAILADPALHSLIDEFFYEQHVSFLPMLKHWGSSIDPTLHLEDTYKLLHRMRTKGIRAHGWP